MEICAKFPWMYAIITDAKGQMLAFISISELILINLLLIWIIDLNWSTHAKIPFQIDYRTSENSEEKARAHTDTRSAIHLIVNYFKYLSLVLFWFCCFFSFIHSMNRLSLHNFPLHLVQVIIPLAFSCTSSERVPLCFCCCWCCKQRSRFFIALWNSGTRFSQ